MSTKNFLMAIFGLILIQASFAQQITEADPNYYDDWAGTWYAEVDGRIDETPSFRVTQSLYDSAFEEIWMGPGGYFSKAWRAWDGRNKSWEFAYMSIDGLFQIWSGKKVDGIWYSYKTFILENGQEVLSRQAFIPQGADVLIRTSEHSKDDGKTWTLRFKEKYVKK